jgi:reactive chlorine resistance protein C
MHVASHSLPTEEMLVKKLLQAKSRTSLEKLGMRVSRYGLVVTLLLIGALKFTAGEAQAIQPLVASSPLMSWLYKVLSVQAVSNLIGMIEICVAVLIALRAFSVRLSFIGSIGATITFLR